MIVYKITSYKSQVSGHEIKRWQKDDDEIICDYCGYEIYPKLDGYPTEYKIFNKYPTYSVSNIIDNNIHIQNICKTIYAVCGTIKKIRHYDWYLNQPKFHYHYNCDIDFIKSVCINPKYNLNIGSLVFRYKALTFYYKRNYQKQIERLGIF